MTRDGARAPRRDPRPVRRALRFLLLLPALAASIATTLPPASAQGVPANEIPAIVPFPQPKVPTPPLVPSVQYDCPTGYAKPDLLQRVQNLRICFPVGNAALAPSGIAVDLPGARTAIGGVTNGGGPGLPCGGRTGFYACGRNAMECCPLTQDNPCFAGAYACKADASQGGANTTCCLR
jgi:hypothetical protein